MTETKNSTTKQKLYSNSSLKGDIKYIFRSAKKNHTQHAEILNSLKARVYESAKYKTLPQYMRTNINGYIEANFDTMYDCLDWVHWYNDKFVGKNLPYGKGFKQELINKSCHVYKDTQKIYS
jgi:hypothetical protein|tara:strand:+ start:59 stop:424 length:366 start_codon:yes stop_codon:yes gene_type:complete